MIRIRGAIEAIPTYVPGKSAEMVANEHRLTEAIKLASNEVPYPPTAKVLAAIADAAAGGHRYPDDNSAALRAALAARHGLGEDEVLVAGGSVTMVGQFILATCDAGDEVVYCWPSFEAYPILSMHAGATARTAPLRDETYDLDAMADLVGERTRCVFVCTPNNPTSTAVRRDALEAFLDRVPTDCLVVVDEAYREFVTDPDVADGLEVLRGHDNVVVLRTFSKAYSLAGFRVGYAFGRPDVIAALRKTRPPFPVAGVAQAAALAALDDRDEIGRRLEEIVAERARVTAALREAGYAVPESQANFVWLPVREAGAPLAAYCESRGVVLRGFAGLGVRATIGTPEENTRMLEVLEKAVADGLVETTGA
jgi:histidinol-phosphate aminotransferase